MKYKRVLVTGGAGFLGSHLCTRLLDAGHEVICVDNFYTGARRNVHHLMDYTDFELIRHDITQPFHFEADFIFNLASPASPIHYQRSPVQTVKTNVLGSINMLDLAKTLEIPILQCSTSEVYGDPEIHPQTEDYWGKVNPIGIRACYDEGKRCAETLFFDYHRQYGVEIKILRLFNTYGPRMQPDDGRVNSNFIIQALKGEDLTIYGQGEQTRSFCYVSDMIDLFVEYMKSDLTLPGPINAGNPGEFTILELAQTVLEITGSRSKIKFLELPEDDPKQRRPDIGLAMSHFDWKPSVELASGLGKTIKYFDALLKEV